VQATFPQFQRLVDLGAESYCAVPLRAKSGAVIGLLVVMDTKPLQQGDYLQSLLGVFAPRIAAEFERKRAEQERTQALADLHNVIETIPDIVFVLDNQGNLVKWNRRLGDVTGYSEEELLHKPALAFVPPEEQLCTAAAIQRVFTEGYAELEGHLLTKDHHLIPYHWTGARLMNSEGQMVGITGVGRDVSERKTLEEEMRVQRASLVAAQALAHVGSWEWDIESGSMEWSDEQFRIFGHEPQSIAMTQETFLAALLPDDHDPVLAAIDSALARQALYDVEYRIVRPSGEVRTLHCRGEVHRDDKGHPVSMYGSALDITDRKRAELALTQSEEHFRALIEHSSDIITVLGLDGTIRYESPSFERRLGYAQQELNGRIAFEFVHEDDLPAVLERFQLVVQRPGEPQTAEFRFRHKDNSWRIFEGIGQAIRDSQGLLSVIVNSREITERKRGEQALRTSQEKLRQALQASNTGLWDWNTETSEVSFSREWKRQLGYEEAELTDAFESWETRLHPDDHEWAVAFVQTFLVNRVGDYRQEFRLRHKDGTYRWIEARASFVTEPDGRRIRLIGSHTDITERKRAEELLSASKKQLQDILDSLFGFVALYTLDGRIVEINRAPLEIGGVSKEDVLDRYFWETPWWSGLPDMQSRLQDWMGRAAQGEIARGEMVFRVPGGHMATADATFGPLRDAAGAIINVIGFGVDITERKRAEEALRSSEFRLNKAQRLAQIGSWELDLLTNNLTWSDEIYRIFEIDSVAFQASYEGFLNLVHPDDLEMVDRACSDSVASRTPYDITHRLLMKDGRIKFVQEQCRTDYLPDGTPERSLGTVQDITERKQTEDALQFLSTGITHLSGEAFFSEMAIQVAKLLGLEIGFVVKLLATQPPRIRAIGLSIDGQAMPPVEYDLAQTPCERVIGKQTAIFPEDVQQLFPDDQMLVDLGVSSYAAIPLFDMGGRPIGHVGVMSRRPLHRVKQVEHLLRLFSVRAAAELERQRTETKFHDLFEFSPDAIIMVNQEGLVTLANCQAESLFGYSRAEFLGLPVERLMPETSGQANMELRQQFLSFAKSRMMGTSRSTLRALKKDGTIFPIDISLSPIQSEEGLLVVAAVRDITERKQTEEALRISEERFRAAYQNAVVGMSICDMTGRLLEVNQALCEILGYSKQELLATDFQSLTHPDDLPGNLDRIRELMTGAVLHQVFEKRYLRKDGDTLWTHVGLSLIRNQDGTPLHLLAMVQNITERKRIQAEEAIRLQRLKQLAAWSLTLVGEPGEVFAEAVRIIGELFDVRTVCLSEVVGAELYFRAVFVAGQVVRDAGHCPLAITPCATVETTKDLRMFDQVMERFPEASFLRDHQTVAYCGIPSLDSRGQVVAVTCLLDDKPHVFDEEEQELLRIFGQRIATEIERSQHLIERSLAEKDRRESDERFNYAIEATSDGIWDWDIQTGAVYFSPQWIRMLGYQPAEIIFSTEFFFTILHPEDVARTTEVLQEHLDGRIPVKEVEVRLRQKSGEYRWYLDRGKVVVRDKDGCPLRMVGTITDITERKQAEAALRESEARYRTVVDLSPNGVFVYSNGKKVYVNRAACAILGAASPEQVLDNSTVHFSHPDESESIHASIAQILATGEPVRRVERRYQKVDGTEISVEVDAGRIIWNGKPAIQVVFADITERKWAEERLRRREQELQTVLDALPVGVWFTDRSGKPLLANPAAKQIWSGVKQIGIETDADVVGWSEATGLSGGLHRWALSHALTTGAASLHDTFDLECVDGTKKTIRNSAVPVKDDAGIVIGAIVLNEDVTMLRRAQEALKLTQFSVDRAVEGFFWIDPDARIIHVNDAACRMLEYTSEELTSMTIHDIDPNFPPEVWPDHWRELKEKGSLTFESKHWLKSGRVLDTEVTINYLQYEGKEYNCAIMRDIGDRKRAEEALRQSQAILQSFVEHAPAAVAMLDTDLRYVIVSKRWYEDYQLKDRDITSLRHYDVFSEIKQNKRWQDDYRRCLAGEIIRGNEDRFVRADGKEDWLQWEVRPWTDGFGSIGGIIMSTENITERKRADLELRERNNRALEMHQALLEIARFDYGELAFSEGIQAVTEIVAEMLGVERVSLWLLSEDRIEMVCQNLYERSQARHSSGSRLRVANFPHYFYAIEDSLVMAVSDALADPRTRELAEGYLFPLRITSMMEVPIRRQGKLIGVFCCEQVGLSRQWSHEVQSFCASVGESVARMMEAAERERMEAALRASEDQFNKAFTEAAIGMGLVAPDGRWLQVNHALCEIIGYSQEELEATTFHAITHPDDRLLDLAYIDQLLMGEIRTYEMEKRYLHKQGHVVWILLSVSLVRTADGAPAHFVKQIQDITERKRIEGALRQRERELQAALEERERISQDLHDGILQSLFSVGLALESSKLTMSPGSRKTSGASLDPAIRQLNLVMGEIRSFIAGLGSDLLKGKDMSAVLRQMLASLTENQPTRVRLAVEGRAAKALSAEQSLHLIRVIQESVSNCIRHGRAKEARVSLKMLKQGVRLTIRDNGRGFNLATSKGTGHGLENMASRAQKIGGRFSVSSKPKEGTSIVLDLPATGQGSEASG
ncbi:MAG: PAS domain S-box protein, partial [Nitrospira sp.]|nr:PAS domain S-box protein [Nitrospira sp.]